MREHKSVPAVASQRQRGAGTGQGCVWESRGLGGAVFLSGELANVLY